MPRTYAFAYIRTAMGTSKTALENEQQLAEGYYHSKLAHLGWGGIFTDVAEARKRPLAERPAGKVLNGRLDREDQVIVTATGRAFQNQQDLVRIVDVWTGRGIGMHMLDLGIDTTTEEGRRMVKLLTDFITVAKEWRAERTRESAALRKTQGKAANKFAGYGFKWAGKKGHRRRVPDVLERRIMNALVRWRFEGYSWEEIYWHLAENKVKTSMGMEWSVIRIRRAFVAALRM
jgi:DNA invertase Pin-like site-specific DNA recombinase